MNGQKNLFLRLALFGVLLALISFSTPVSAQMAHQVLKGTAGDDTLITLGTPEKDYISQYRLGGNDTEYISGGDGDNRLEQDGGVSPQGKSGRNGDRG
ncbi:MAG: hypothetical protein ACUVSG_08820 [Anaerolineae bacterium]